MDEWKERLVEDPEAVLALMRGAKRIAVLGIKPDDESIKPAHGVPAYLQAHGYDIVPVPVKDVPGGTILGRQVYRTVAAVPGPVDVVEVFRKPADIDAHVDDLIAKKPGAVWFQLGIRNDAAAERLARAGIRVVQDRCMKIEHRRLQG
jgi:predicted CoA-binding protein